MTQFQPRNPAFEAQARASFARQAMMATLGMEVDAVTPGDVTLSMPHDERFTQQHGFLHGGITAAGMDTACGFAALTLMEPEAGVLTVEYKTNLLSPAKGERFVFNGSVIKPGRTITVAEGRAYALDNGKRKLIATLTATLMTVTGRDDVKG